MTVLHLAWQAAHDHLWAAAMATANLAVAVFLGAPVALGAEVNDGLLTGAVLFVLATGTGIAGWALVLIVRLTNDVTRNSEQIADHERRIEGLER